MFLFVDEGNQNPKQKIDLYFQFSQLQQKG